MSESQSKTPQPHASSAEVLELASAMLDGEHMGDAAVSHLETLRTLPQVQQFQRDARRVSTMLQRIPVQALTSPLVSIASFAPRDRVSSDVKILASVDESARPPRQKFAGVVSILAMAGCLLIALIAPHSDESDLPRITSSWKVRKAAASAVAEFPSEEQWNVVVVRMDDQDRTAAMQAVQKVVRDHGFDFARSAGKEMPEWMGVVLSAGADESQALLDDLRNTVSIESVEQDPSRIAESSREELIAAVQESLRYPTMSELHHGKVYLAMPESDPQGEHDQLIAANTAEPNAGRETDRLQQSAESDLPSAMNAGSASQPATPLRAAASREGVMLVVFQFAAEPAADLKI